MNTENLLSKEMKKEKRKMMFVKLLTLTVCLSIMMCVAFAAPTTAQQKLINKFFANDGLLRNVVAFVIMLFGAGLFFSGIFAWAQSKTSDNGEQEKTGFFRWIVGAVLFFAPFFYDMLGLSALVSEMFP